MGRLDGKTALVTGAARGIGRATVECFAAEGARVIATDLSVPDHVEALDSVLWMPADVCSEADMAAAVAAAEADGGLDICVANAGIAGIEDFLEGSADSWMAVLRVNLLGAMVSLQAAARAMVTHGRGGRLLATASIAGLRGEASAPAYGASKGGVLALMRALAVELAPHRITVNSVAPGQIDTELNAADVRVLSARAGVAFDDYRASALAAAVPAGRLGRPQEVAAVFAFLASDAGEFITGETVRIDGGELAI